MTTEQLILNSLQDTARIAKNIANIITTRDIRILNLNGDLGSGKTTFCRYLVRELNEGEHVHSPTFTLMNEYKGEPPIFHFDFYRLESEDDLVSINIEDYLPADPGVSIIEWGNKFEHILPENRIDLDFYYHGSDSRLIKLSKNLQEMIEK